MIENKFPKYVRSFDGYLGTFRYLDFGEFPVYRFDGGERIADEFEIKNGSDDKEEIMKEPIDRNIKKWYLENYPEDDFAAKNMKEKSTFGNLFIALDTYRDVYKVLFVENTGDSLIRERCFTRLAQILDVDYNYVWDQYLKGR